VFQAPPLGDEIDHLSQSVTLDQRWGWWLHDPLGQRNMECGSAFSLAICPEALPFSPSNGMPRSLHSGPVELVNLLANMNCLPTAHYLAELVAKHSTLFTLPWSAPCRPLTAPRVQAKIMIGHVHPRLTSSMHNQRAQHTTSLFKVLLSISLLKLALEV